LQKPFDGNRVRKFHGGFEMVGRIKSGAKALFAVIFGGALFQIRHGLKKTIIRDRPDTIEDQLYKIARVTGKSEYDVFCKSAESWPIPSDKIEQDFKAYLLHQSVPYYVVDFVRKNKKHIDELRLPLF
jgi:hypothetical protein